jgi:hypothetical protein
MENFVAQTLQRAHLRSFLVFSSWETSRLSSVSLSLSQSSSMSGTGFIRSFWIFSLIYTHMNKNFIIAIKGELLNSMGYPTTHLCMPRVNPLSTNISLYEELLCNYLKGEESKLNGPGLNHYDTCQGSL